MITYLESIYKLLMLVFGQKLGVNGIPPVVNAGTGARTAANGHVFYKLFPIASPTVLLSAKDINGVAISALASYSFVAGVPIEVPLSEYTLTSGSVIEYQTPKDINTYR